MGDFISSLPGAITLGAIWGIMGIGVYLTFKILNFADLTVDGSFVTGAAVCGVVIINGGSFYLGLLLGFFAGLIAGLITGLLHTFLGITPILSGILTQLSLWSINLKILGSRSNISISARTFDVLITQLKIGNSLWILALVILLLITILYAFFGTELGSSIRATGNNENMAKAQGINTKINKVLGLMLSNGIVAFAGALLAQYQGFSDINMGRGAIVIGLCAVIIGEAIVTKISKNFAVRLFGVILGGVIYYLIYQFIFFIGLDTDYLKMLSALVVAILLGLPYLKSTIVPRMKKKKENKKFLKKSSESESEVC